MPGTDYACWQSLVSRLALSVSLVRRSPEDEGCIRSAEAERIGHRELQSRSESLVPYKSETARVVYLAHVRGRWSDLVSQCENG